MNSDMLDYVAKRLFMGLLIVITVSILLFIFMQMMPGDPIQIISSPRVPIERIQELKQMWGLDKPLHIQYFFWLRNILKGDLGTSITTGQKVSRLIMARLPYTLMLSGLAMLCRYIIAIPMGLIAAIKKGSKLDNGFILTNLFLWSTPPQWLAMILIIIFGITLKVLPISGYNGLRSMVLPVATMVIPSIAMSFGLTRSDVIDALNEKFVLTAYAKGLPKKRVMIFHVLRNSLIPITVMFFLSLPWHIGGSVLIERIFALPGMGMLFWKAISQQDYPVVQGVVLIITILTAISNIIGDILSATLDPRIRLE